MKKSERATTSLVDEYDGLLRRIVDSNTKIGTATRLRERAGRLFAQGDKDVTAHELRAFAEDLEQAAEDTAELQDTLVVIYTIIRNRHEGATD